MDMQIEKRESGERVEVYVEGSPASIGDSEELKEEILRAYSEPERPLDIYFATAPAISSNLIGFFMKAIKADKADLRVFVKNRELYESLRRLNMLDIINVNRY